MALTSADIGLLFKLQADSSEAKQSVANFRQFLNSSLKESAGEAEQSAAQMSGAFQTFGVVAGGAVAGVAAVITAGLVVAVGAVTAAVTAATLATEKMVDVAGRVGTESKDEFDKFADSLRKVGVEVTGLDRQLSVGITQAVDLVKNSFDSLFLVLIRQAGPQLIVLLQDVAKWLVSLAPLATQFGNALARGFAIASASVRTLKDNLDLLFQTLKSPGTLIAGLPALLGIGKQNYDAALADATKIKLPAAPFRPTGGGARRAAPQDSIGPDGRSDPNFAQRERERMLREREKADEEFGKRILQLRREQIRQEEELQRLADQREIARIRDLADQRIITNEEAEARIAQIKAQRLAETEDALNQQLAIQTDQRGEIEGRLAALEIQRTILIEESNRRVADARQRDLDDQQRYLDERIRQQREAQEVEQMLAEERERMHRESPFGQLEEMGLQAFNQLAQGIGGLVQNYVLLGETGPAAMKKLLAATLATLAAEATVRAIMELAKGVAALFLNPAQAAAHFKAAALFGAAAVAAGVAGRAIAPSSGGGAGAAGAGGGSAGSGGGGRTIYEQGNRQPVQIIVRAEPGIIVNHVMRDYRNNGASRSIIRRDVVPGEG